MKGNWELATHALKFDNQRHKVDNQVMAEVRQQGEIRVFILDSLLNFRYYIIVKDPSSVQCPMCGKAEMVITQEPYLYDESGLNVTLADLDISSCHECGARMASIPAISKLHELLANFIAQKPGPRLPEEDRFLRTHELTKLLQKKD